MADMLSPVAVLVGFDDIAAVAVIDEFPKLDAAEHGKLVLGRQRLPQLDQLFLLIRATHETGGDPLFWRSWCVPVEMGKPYGVCDVYGDC